MGAIVLHSFLLLGAPVATQAFSGAGQGSSNNPFRVSTCDQLQSIAEDTSAHYALENDIDCSATATWNTNTGFVPISSFGGVLDGRNFTISGLHASPASGNAGLLANLTGAVKNLKLTAEYISGHSASGGLAGSITNGATVTNVSVSGDITGGNSVGGLIGYAENSTISRSSATGTVTSTVAWAGGLIGYDANTSVDNSFANTTITGNNTSGGLTGSIYVDSGNTVTIENSYTAGSITDLNGKAGFVANSQGSGGVIHYINDFTTMTGYDGNHVQQPMSPFQNNSAETQPDTTNFYFDQDAAGTANCAADFSLECTPVNTDGNSNHYFWGSLSAGPLGAWDFGTIWNTYDNLPYLRDADLNAIDTLSAPSAPQNLTFKGQDGGMNVSWDDPTSNGGSPLRDYSIQMRPSDGDGSWETLSHSPGYANFIGIGGPANGDYYDVRVAVINDIGIGEYAEIDHTMVGAAPGQVQNFVFTNGITTIGGSWSAPADPGYSAVDHYQFAFRTTGQNGWATYDVGGLSAGINGVNPGHYDVRVRAVSVNGPGDWSYLNNQYVGSQVYNITTCQELQDIQNDMGGHYTLAHDIDCSETSTWNNGSGFSPIGITIDADFTGSLDGQGHIITGLHEDNSSFSHGPYNLGLFYSTEGATIQNLSINDSTFLGSGDAGAFASYADNTTASNLRSNASVISTITDNVGGLFGSFRGDDDRTQVVLSASAFTGTARGDYLLGGLVGYSSNVTIQDSYVHGTVISLNGGNYIGGIVGVADNTAITNVYSTAKVESDGNPNASYFGGLVGLMETNSQISNSFAAGSVDTSVDVYGAQLLQPAQLPKIKPTSTLTAMRPVLTIAQASVLPVVQAKARPVQK